MKDEKVNPSRRAALGAGLAAGVAALTVGMAARAEAQTSRPDAPMRLAQQKLAQNLVQYQTSPKNGQMCSACVNYIDPGQCKLVEGPINPNGWCVAFAPKSS